MYQSKCLTAFLRFKCYRLRHTRRFALAAQSGATIPPIVTLVIADLSGVYPFAVFHRLGKGAYRRARIAITLLRDPKGLLTRCTTSELIHIRADCKSELCMRSLLQASDWVRGKAFFAFRCRAGMRRAHPGPPGSAEVAGSPEITSAPPENPQAFVRLAMIRLLLRRLSTRP